MLGMLRLARVVAAMTLSLGLHGPQHTTSFGFVHQLRYAKQRILRLPRLKPQAAATSEFYAAESQSFTGIGVHQGLEVALQRAGIMKPSRIQELVAPVMLTGKNAVIAAETGSGKTLSYLAPIMTLLLRMKERQSQEGVEKPKQFHALVLCPNGALCQQVVSTVEGLKNDEGQPLLTAAQVNSSNPPPFNAPDIIVATPAGLKTLIDGAGASYGLLWTPEGMQARVKHVVLDEADLLMGKAFERPVQSLLQLFRSGDRRRVEAKIYDELQIDEHVFKTLPRELQVAAWRGGTPGLLAAGYRASRRPQEGAKMGPYWKRQYVFVAATMPSVTFSDVGSQIQYMYPEAEWVSTESLHTSKPKLSHIWVEVDNRTYHAALVSAIKSDPNYTAKKGKILVFARDTAAADKVSEQLQGENIQHVVYHKSRPMEEREAALEVLRSGHGVMVCTDAAARGIDIQDVTHVIQADFAANAIDFIHRIGRTGRVDKAGQVTSLYREANKALVEVLQGFIAEGQPLEAAFSRARSFSKKLKRHSGQFVPRGMGTQGAEAANSSEGVKTE